MRWNLRAPREQTSNEFWTPTSLTLVRRPRRSSSHPHTGVEIFVPGLGLLFEQYPLADRSISLGARRAFFISPAHTPVQPAEAISFQRLRRRRNSAFHRLNNFTEAFGFASDSAFIHRADSR